MSGLRCFTRLAFLKSTFSQRAISHVKFVPSYVHCKLYATESKTNFIDTDSKTSALVEVLQNVGVDMELITITLESSSEIRNVSPGQVEKCFSELIHNGFSGDSCLKMVTLYPPLLKVREGYITSAMDTWRSTQLGDARINSLLQYCPHFICMNLSEVPQRISRLKSLSDQKNIAKLLRTAPNLMFENWNQVVAKMDYLEKVMKIDKKHIINSYALNRSLAFLKTRHVFLERCGVYKTPKSKVDPNEPNKNPALSSITDTDDDWFAVKVAGVSKEEYEVFQELYQQELEEEESDSDSE